MRENHLQADVRALKIKYYDKDSTYPKGYVPFCSKYYKGFIIKVTEPQTKKIFISPKRGGFSGSLTAVC